MSSSDFGPDPIIIDFTRVAKDNSTFRTSVWTGQFMQITVMSLLPNEDIGLEKHDHLDQIVVVEEGEGLLLMGKKPHDLDLSSVIEEGEGFVVPAGYWHNFTNISNAPLKLFSIYGPPSHPFGTMQQTKADAMASEEGISLPESDSMVPGTEA